MSALVSRWSSDRADAAISNCGELAQPAQLCVQWALCEALLVENCIPDTAVRCVLGHSLGELAACAVHIRRPARIVFLL